MGSADVALGQITVGTEMSSGISTIVDLMLVWQPAASSGQRGSMAGWLHTACLLPSSLGPMFLLPLAPNTCGKGVAYQESSMVSS